MQGLKINILRCMFFSWDYRPPVIFSVCLQPLEISEMLGKNTHARHHEQTAMGHSPTIVASWSFQKKEMRN